MTSLSEIDALGILWMLRLDGSLPGDPKPRIPAEFLRAGPELAGELAHAMGYNNPSLVLQRFSLGKQCYVARVDGQLAAYGWITFDKEDIGELGLVMRLNKGEAYIWDCTTLPAYRGQRLYPALLAHMLVELQRTGFERIWIGTDMDNLPSQSGVARVGCQPILEIIPAPAQDKDHKYLSRGRPGVPLEDMLDAHYAMFGNRDTDRIVFTEEHR